VLAASKTDSGSVVSRALLADGDSFGRVTVALQNHDLTVSILVVSVPDVPSWLSLRRHLCSTLSTLNTAARIHGLKFNHLARIAFCMFLAFTEGKGQSHVNFLIPTFCDRAAVAVTLSVTMHGQSVQGREARDCRYLNAAR
jgi:hypothetical protein